ncbi:MAG: proton-translocating NADH-quinone oxidoreductase, chain [Gammaproteobacteria bacterium]|nr:proton-translocating NADH-quinone oxidoreductase, chain [Gammaproteobacteria bacterium]
MNLSAQQLSFIVILAPLLGSLFTGFLGKALGTKASHRIAVTGLGIAFIAALFLCHAITFGNTPPRSFNIYTWALSGTFQFNIGFTLDSLSTIMAVLVTFISFLVHIYSIGYMAGDPGYQRFFSYISLFTFAMLLLVLSNNFLQLFIGWEGVGLVSYLLIGFWFKRDSANAGSFKAFIVNRIGDFGFLLGIALVLAYFGTLNYEQVFAEIPVLANATIRLFPGTDWSLITVICILLFIGAMGKSAQMPLHVWLPESMEGPTPISALIHAATMVTAGIFMICRMSPLYEHSPTALSVVLVVGATGALFTGLIGIVQYDIKRVVAYSTLSQLGYMVAGLGASAYSASLFHLATHACFKALLFLGAGSVIMGMHHDQDMRNMGGLRRYMPITYTTFLIGSLALAAIPPFAGYYSKDAIIEAIGLTQIPGATYAYICVLLGAFVTALYTFRAFFLVFHTQERMDEHTREHLHESPSVVWLPLVCLAVPSIVLGFLFIKPMLYTEPGLLGSSVITLPAYDVLSKMAEEYHGIAAATWQGLLGAPFWLSVFGIFCAWYAYQKAPETPAKLARRFSIFYRILVNKYGFDDFNQTVIVRSVRNLSSWFYFIVDTKCIDNYVVNGTGRMISFLSRLTRQAQTGYLYHYAFVMILGVLIFLCWLMI